MKDRVKDYLAAFSQCTDPHCSKVTVKTLSPFCAWRSFLLPVVSSEDVLYCVSYTSIIKVGGYATAVGKDFLRNCPGTIVSGKKIKVKKRIS